MILLRNILTKSFTLTLAFLLSVTLTTHTEKPSVSSGPSTQSHPQTPANKPQEKNEENQKEPGKGEEESPPRKINSIVVLGNKHVPKEALLAHIPYKVGDVFDTGKTHQLISTLYHDLNRLSNISVYSKNTGSNTIDLFIVVEEKKLLEDVVFEGNKQVSNKEIQNKIKFNDIRAVDRQELKRYALAIAKMYKEKGYHKIDIDTDLIVNNNDRATAVFKITEHAKAIVKRIRFKGNKNISSKTLRTHLFTKEEWILSAMDKSGTYLTERIEGDRHAIEQLYQNSGYMNAKVVDVQTILDPTTQFITLIYEIQEGDRYTISSVKAPGNDILKEEYILSLLPVKVGDVYSRENLGESIKCLEFIWGELGYAYANIEPSLSQNDDDKTVSITFFSDIGKPVHLNKLTIKGNKKTRDKIIRRTLSLEEGGLITTRHMDASKSRVQALGYFNQRSGVNWKMTRLSEDTADLDLIVDEAKTGSAHVQFSIGGSAASIKSGSAGPAVEGTLSDRNLFGKGINMNLTGRIGKDEKTLIFNYTQPWMFDRPIYGSMDIYHKRVNYDTLSLTHPINEKYTGGTLTSGFMTHGRNPFLNDTFIHFSLGLDNIKYESFTGVGGTSFTPTASIKGLGEETITANNAYNTLLNKLFSPGTFSTFSCKIGKDAKNHPVHPSSGYTWNAKYQVSAAAFNSCIGFNKIDIEGNWFTPLIGDFDLILHLHGQAGWVKPFKNKLVPYRELFHIGGPNNVRGFLFGEIGPQFVTRTNNTLKSDSIGGDKSFFLNMELIFPIKPDFSMKGVVFYDGGAGWNNPYTDSIPSKFISNNGFNYRHSIGVGLRLLQPLPLKIDWGFKLDARKNESASEIHFSMSYDW